MPVDPQLFPGEQLPFWNSLTPEEKEFVRGNAVFRQYQKGEMIHGGEQDCLGLVLVLEGELRASILSQEGREITLFRLNPGEPCVLSASCVIRQITFHTQITAEKDTRLLILRSGDFSRLTGQNIYARCFMYELLTQRFSSVMWTMQAILFQGYDRRLAAFLLEEYHKTGSPRLSMTHEQIARNTNTAREVVTRMLKRFASEGMVELGRGFIRLKDLSALEDLA